MAMNNTEQTDIAVIKNDVDWIKKTISDRFKELGTKLDGIPLAIETTNKRIDSNEDRLTSLETKFADHMVQVESLTVDHKLNTKFREQSSFIIKHFWKIVSVLGLGTAYSVVQEALKLISEVKP